MYKVWLIFGCIFFSQLIRAQTFEYSYELKLAKEKCAQKAKKTIELRGTEILVFPFMEVGQLDTIKYQLVKEDNYINILSLCKGSLERRKQYPLDKKDTLIFRSLNYDGFCEGSTDGLIYYVNDTIHKVGKRTYNCYHFIITSHNKSNSYSTTKTDVFLDKHLLIPIYTYQGYYNSKGEKMKDAYQKIVLKKIRKQPKK